MSLGAPIGRGVLCTPRALRPRQTPTWAETERRGGGARVAGATSSRKVAGHRLLGSRSIPSPRARPVTPASPAGQILVQVRLEQFLKFSRHSTHPQRCSTGTPKEPRARTPRRSHLTWRRLESLRGAELRGGGSGLRALQPHRAAAAGPRARPGGSGLCCHRLGPAAAWRRAAGRGRLLVDT